MSIDYFFVRDVMRCNPTPCCYVCDAVTILHFESRLMPIVY